MIKKLKGTWELVKRSGADWIADKVPMHAGALAFYTLFSLSPLVMIVVSIAGLWYGAEAAREEVIAQLEEWVGAEAANAIQVVMGHARDRDSGVIATVTAITTLFIGATVVFAQLQDSLNSIWSVRTKSTGSGIWAFVRTRIISFAMVLVIGFLLLVSLLLSATVSALSRWMAELLPGIPFLWQVLDFAVSFGMVALLFAMIFKVLPDVKIAWGDVWVGAVITALLFVIGKFLLGLYIGVSAPGSAYGAAGSLVVLLIWIYYSSMILFFGAEITQIYARRYGKKIRPAEYAEFIPGSKISEEPW